MRKGAKVLTQKSTATSLPSGCLKLYLKSVSANVESCCGWYPSIRNRSTSLDFPTAESPSKMTFTAFLDVTCGGDAT